MGIENWDRAILPNLVKTCPTSRCRNSSSFLAVAFSVHQTTKHGWPVGHQGELINPTVFLLGMDFQPKALITESLQSIDVSAKPLITRSFRALFFSKLHPYPQSTTNVTNWTDFSVSYKDRNRS